MEYDKLENYEGIYPVVQFFQYAHLSPDKQIVSRPFGELALHLCQNLQDKTETVKALDLLLAAKDAAVRSSFQK